MSHSHSLLIEAFVVYEYARVCLCVIYHIGSEIMNKKAKLYGNVLVSIV